MKVQLATHVDDALRHRLRVYAAITDRKVQDVVSEALDGFLPAAPDLVRAIAQPIEIPAEVAA